MLYIVATPIGNLEDITLRALRILKEVDLIAAEDTRHSRKLLQHYEIQTPLTSYHSHSSNAKIESLVEKLKEGQQVALISDAGTPGISDPAWSLIQAVLELNTKENQEPVAIVPIPGPSAFLAALMGSGMPMNQFHYLGFIPAKKGRQTLFESLKEEKRTTVLYESPHRLVKSLSQMLDSLGPERQVVIAREITKMHETFHRGSLSELHEHFSKNPPKGEMVIVLGPEGF